MIGIEISRSDNQSLIGAYRSIFSQIGLRQGQDIECQFNNAVTAVVRCQSIVIGARCIQQQAVEKIAAADAFIDLCANIVDGEIENNGTITAATAQQTLIINTCVRVGISV